MKVKVKLQSVPITVQYRDQTEMISLTQLGFSCEGAEFEVEVQDGEAGLVELMTMIGNIATSAAQRIVMIDKIV